MYFSYHPALPSFFYVLLNNCRWTGTLRSITPIRPLPQDPPWKLGFLQRPLVIRLWWPFHGNPENSTDKAQRAHIRVVTWTKGQSEILHFTNRDLGLLNIIGNGRENQIGIEFPFHLLNLHWLSCSVEDHLPLSKKPSVSSQFFYLSRF